MNKQDITNFLRKYRNFFLSRNVHIIFKKIRKYTGTYDLDKDGEITIVLDPRWDIIATLIHEVLHYIYPDLCETEILKMESKLVRNLSDRQLKSILETMIFCMK